MNPFSQFSRSSERSQNFPKVEKKVRKFRNPKVCSASHRRPRRQSVADQDITRMSSRYQPYKHEQCAIACNASNEQDRKVACEECKLIYAYNRHIDLVRHFDSTSASVGQWQVSSSETPSVMHRENSGKIQFTDGATIKIDD